jgi:hypothetical protein
MNRRVLRIVLATALIGEGWSVGNARVFRWQLLSLRPTVQTCTEQPQSGNAYTRAVSRAPVRVQAALTPASPSSPNTRGYSAS